MQITGNYGSPTSAGVFLCTIENLPHHLQFDPNFVIPYGAITGGHGSGEGKINRPMYFFKKSIFYASNFFVLSSQAVCFGSVSASSSSMGDWNHSQDREWCAQAIATVGLPCFCRLV